MTESIYFAKSDKRKEFTLKILDIFKDYIKEKVFIKVNEVSYEEYPTTTHPEILETVIEYLQDNGREITCGDGHGIDVREKKVKNTTIRQICKKYSVRFLSLFNGPVKKFKSPRGFKIKMSSVPFEADSLISLPILKSHPRFEMTGALKMCVGYFTTFERIKMHMKIAKNRWKMIAEANWFLTKQESSPTHLTIMDAVQTMIKSNEFRHGGIQADLGYLLASDCPSVLDIYGFNLLKEVEPRFKGKDIDHIKYLKYAIDYGLGGPEYELKEIQI